MPSTLNIIGSTILQKNMEAATRFVMNEGGARSTKTFSIAQTFISKGIKETGQIFSICRKTMPALRTSAMRDFFSLLETYQLYSEYLHNKSENTYHLNGNEFEFFGLDQPKKVRGRKRKYLWMNETNEFALEDFMQLNLRTTGQIFGDYNPSDEDHWIYDRVLSRTDCTLIKSTYKDNPFLEPEVIKEIEMLKESDGLYWQIYGLGNRGKRRNLIHTNWDICKKLPDSFDEILYGIDFGMNHPTVLLAVVFKDGELYVDERIYQSGLNNSMLMPLMDEKIPEQFAPIYPDIEDTNRVDELSRYIRKSGEHFNIGKTIKGKDSVKEGIDRVNAYKLHITEGSTNTIKEIKMYKWKEDTRTGKLLDEPVRFMDDAMNALRYPVFSHPLAGKFEVLFEV